MIVSGYLSKRISWDAPFRLPRLSIPSVFRSRAPKNTLECQEVDDTSTDITAISYPSLPAASGRSKLHAYIRRASGPFIRRFKPQPVEFPSMLETTKLNVDNMPVIYSIFQLPTPPTSPTTPISPASSLPIQEFMISPKLQADSVTRVGQYATYETMHRLDCSLLDGLREERPHKGKRSKELAEQEGTTSRDAKNDWRRWARRTLARVPQAEKGTHVAHFAVRLPCGQRRTGSLPSDASLETLYLFVETLFIPPSFRPEDDPEDPPEGYEHRWSFKLVTTNSRFVLPHDLGSKICGSEIMWKSALLIVEEVDDGDLETPLKVL